MMHAPHPITIGPVPSLTSSYHCWCWGIAPWWRVNHGQLQCELDTEEAEPILLMPPSPTTARALRVLRSPESELL
jgi:hypothetical protein